MDDGPLSGLLRRALLGTARQRGPGRAGFSRTLLELLAPSSCPCCDRPRREGQPLLCAWCSRGLRGQSELRGIPTAFAYEETAARLIQRFKFEQRSDALEVLLGPLLARLRDVRAELIVPVPRHPARIREQGCDPAFSLARAVARRSPLVLAGGVLRRTREALPQTGLSRKARLANVRGSFAARRGALRGRRVVLLDDVTTTGATLREAARVLRGAAGAQSLTPVALAGTPAL